MATPQPIGLHPDWKVLAASWELSLRADGYSPKTVRIYRIGLANLTDWLGGQDSKVAPCGLGRQHVRGWLADLRSHSSATTAKTYFAGVRHFCAWLVAEGEATGDATKGLTYPAPAEASTPVLTVEELRRLLATCAGAGFADRRDAAIILTFADGGLRLAELRGLQVADVDLPSRVLLVAGKGSQRSGPRHRAVPLGVKAAKVLDRYLRERRRHPLAASDALWLATGGPLSESGVVQMLRRRAEQAGIEGFHAHVLRHTWAHGFRAAGGSEGDLMVLGGWRNRSMLDRYGKSAAAGRAAEAARRLSLGDRL